MKLIPMVRTGLYLPPDQEFRRLPTHESRSDLRIDTPEAGEQEFWSSWALFILIALVITALFASYILKQKRIQAVHETVLSIFAGSFTSPVLRMECGGR